MYSGDLTFGVSFPKVLIVRTRQQNWWRWDLFSPFEPLFLVGPLLEYLTLIKQSIFPRRQTLTRNGCIHALGQTVRQLGIWCCKWLETFHEFGDTQLLFYVLHIVEWLLWSGCHRHSYNQLPKLPYAPLIRLPLVTPNWLQDNWSIPRAAVSMAVCQLPH